MEKTEIERSSSPVTVETEKHVSIDNVATAEPAQEQPKARPQRIASFKDYVVCIRMRKMTALTELLIETDIFAASLPVRNKMGLCRLRRGCLGLHWRWHHVAVDERSLWYDFLEASCLLCSYHSIRSTSCDVHAAHGVLGNFVGSISDFTNAADQSQEAFRKRADKLSSVTALHDYL